MTMAEYEAQHAALLDKLRSLAAASDWHGIIEACSGSNHGTITHLWALAMTAWYGPVGLADGRFGADGRPDPAKCADVPDVFRRMDEASAKIRRMLGLPVAAAEAR